MNRRVFARTSAAISIAAALASLCAAPRAASACGGCVHEPVYNAVQVVTDHRMVLALSAAQTVLWDQFFYTPSPAGFAWLFPVAPGANVHVDLTDSLFVDALDRVTAPTVTRSCATGDSSVSDAAASSEGGTTVGTQTIAEHESYAPPMDVTIVPGNDPTAIFTWIQSSGYVVPGSSSSMGDGGSPGTAHVATALDAYAALHMDFVAVRFGPSDGTRAMPPVRITIDGYDPTLPLRGIAIGASEEVGAVLMVIAPTRVEAANFPNATLSSAMFGTTGNLVQDYETAFDNIRQQHGDTTWVTESVQPFDRDTLTRALANTPTEMDASTQSLNAAQSDTSAALGTASGTFRVTRMRALVPAMALADDLTLQPSEGGDISTRYVEPGPCSFPGGRVRDAGCLCGIRRRATANPRDGVWLAIVAFAMRRRRHARRS